MTLQQAQGKLSDEQGTDETSRGETCRICLRLGRSVLPCRQGFGNSSHRASVPQARDRQVPRCPVPTGVVEIGALLATGYGSGGMHGQGTQFRDIGPEPLLGELVAWFSARLKACPDEAPLLRGH